MVPPIAWALCGGEDNSPVDHEPEHNQNLEDDNDAQRLMALDLILSLAKSSLNMVKPRAPW